MTDRYLRILGNIKEEEEFAIILIEDKKINVLTGTGANWEAMFTRNDMTSKTNPLKFKYELTNESSKQHDIILKGFHLSKWRTFYPVKSGNNISLKVESDYSQSIPEGKDLQLTLKASESLPQDNIYAGMAYSLYNKDDEKVDTLPILAISSNGNASYTKDLPIYMIPWKLYFSSDGKCTETDVGTSIYYTKLIVDGTLSEPTRGVNKRVLWTSQPPMKQEGSDCSKYKAFVYGDKCDGIMYGKCKNKNSICEFKNNKLRCVEKEVVEGKNGGNNGGNNEGNNGGNNGNDDEKKKDEDTDKLSSTQIGLIVGAVVIVLVILFFFVKSKSS